MNFSLKKIFVISFIIKLCLAWLLPVTLDEYYYFIWGKFPSLSYFDHPPMVGWIMMLSQNLTSFGEGAIRWPFILLSHFTLLIWTVILRPQIQSKKLSWFLIIALLNPLWGLGAVIATPDIPLVFFWSLAIYFALEVLSKNRLTDYVGLGLSLGLGFLSKYQIVLFLPCIFLVIVQQRNLKKFLNYKTLISIFIAALTCSPVFIWNYYNDWSSFSFQWEHGMAAKYWKWSFPIEYVFTQVLLALPPFLLFFFNKNSNWKKDPLLPFMVFPFLFFLYSSFKGRVEANWVIMSFPTLYALSIKYTSTQQFVWVKRSALLWVLCLIVALVTIPLRDKKPFSQINLYESYRFAPILKKIAPSTQYLTYSYQLSAYLTFKTGELFCKLPKAGRLDHFHFVDECKDLPEKFTFITEDWSNPNFPELFPGYQKIDEHHINEKFKFMRVEKL